MASDSPGKQTTKKPAAPTREQARAEYEAKTKGLIFTKDFQTHQDAVIRDPLATVGERFMAWVLRRSWGEYSLYALRDDGEPAYQRDFVQAFGLDKTRVSHVAAYYRARGYLEDLPKLLYPVVSPHLVAPDPKDKKLRAFATFLEGWKVANAADFAKWEDARAIDQNFRKVVHAEYRKLQKQATTAARTLLRDQETFAETSAGAGLSPLEASNLRHSGATTPAQNSVEQGTQTKAQASAFLLKQIRHLQERFPQSTFAKPLLDPENPGDVAFVNSVLRELGTHDEQEIIGFLVNITAKFKGFGLGGKNKTPRSPNDRTGPESVGLLKLWANDYARLIGTSERRRA